MIREQLNGIATFVQRRIGSFAWLRTAARDSLGRGQEHCALEQSFGSVIPSYYPG